MENNIETKYNKLIIAVSIIIPIAVAALFFIDLKTEFPIAMASWPEIRIMAIAPAPDGVASATMESLGIILVFNFMQK